MLGPSPARAARSLQQVSSASPAGSYTEHGGTSVDGRHIVFMSSKQLDPADTDAQIDVYDNFNGINTLVSIGPAGGNGPTAASFDFVSQDGSTVIFETAEGLVASDLDNSADVYARSGGTTTLVSQGPAAGGAYDAFYEGASSDASKIFFGTNEQLAAGDTDSYFDTYVRASGATTLLTVGPGTGNGTFPAEYAGSSADGTRMFFQSTEQLVAADTDAQADLYERVGTTTNLVSIGPDGGNGTFPATYDGNSADGTKVFFTTDESLSAADTGGQDIYRRMGGATAIMTSPTRAGSEEYVGHSPSGDHVYFETRVQAAANDDDSYIDVYDSAGGSISLVSPGNRNAQGAANTYYVGASADAVHFFIRTDEQILAGDGDTNQDLYEVVGGVATLASIGPAGGHGAAGALFAGASQDGASLLFETYESLVSADTDARMDVYERSGGTTTLLSVGSGAIDARFRGMTPDASRIVFRTTEPLLAGDTDTASDIYTSSEPGQVVIVKDAVPDDAQNFMFTIGGGLSLGLQAPPGQTTFELDDDADPTLSNTQTFADVAPGSGYSVTESAAAGWDLTSTTCSNGSPVSNIRVDAGLTTTCTFTNRKRGKIVVVADAQPDDAQDFSFTAGGGLTPASFSLDDDATPALSNTQTFNAVAPGSGYSVSESVPAGWDLTSATCSDGSPVTNIDVSANETVTCTFTNRKRGQVVVVKDAQPNAPFDFAFTAGGGLSPTSFLLDDDSDGTLSNTQTFANVVPGSGYSVAENGAAGWTLTSATCNDGSPVSNIDVAPGEIVTCTFTNERRGTIVVVEDSQPDDAQDFSYTAGGGLSPASFQLDDDADGTLSNTRSFDVIVGSGYSIAQGSVPAGWDLASSTCDDGSPVSSISVSAGETVTCTFTNRKRGTLVVLKDSQPDDAQDFSFTAGGGLSPASFALDDHNNPQLPNTQTFSNLQARNGYSISEAPVSGWFQTSATCSNGSPVSNIDIPPGQTVTCTFVNTKVSRITVVKDAQPNDAQDFSFTATGLSPGSFTLDDDANGTLSNTQVYNNLAAGSGYAVAEAPVAGWEQTSATCSDGSPVTNITLSAGEQITCTFVNRKLGSITVVKDAQPNDAQDFSFTAGGGLSPASFSLDDDSDGTLSNTRTFANVAPAAGYSVAESALSGWSSSGSCNDGSPLTNIDVAPGESVTCTFVNRRTGTIIAIKDAQPDDPQDFSFTAGGGLSPTGFSLDDDSDPALPSGQIFSGLAPRNGYSLSESVPSGWDQQGAICNDGSPISNIDVASSETVTCTFTNRKRGAIVLVEDSQPDDPQDFAFTAGGGLSPTSFSLDDDANPALSNTRTFANLVPGGGYTLAQTVPGGWDQTSATCDNGSPLSNITVGAGQTVTCTVTNRKRGAIVVVKDAVPNAPFDFAFTAGGGLSPASFDLDDDTDPTLSNTRTFADVVPGGGYSIDEGPAAGWDETSASCSDGSAPSDIDVSPGETVTCTFENTKRAQLTIVKDAQPDSAQDFSFTAGGGLSPASFSLDDDADGTLSSSQSFANVVPGTYSVSESPVAGWDLSSTVCSDGSPAAAIDLAPAEHVTCTFTNRQRGTLVVVEDSVPDDPQDFSFSAGGGLSPSSFQLDDDANGTLSNTRTFANVVSGTYSLTETVPGGWLLTSASCDDGSPTTSISIAPGETVTCTFENTKRGRIVVSEDSVPNDPQDFSFTAGGGLSPSGFSLDDDADGTLSNSFTFDGVVPGSGYSVAETTPGGWDLTSATCDDGSATANITVDAGETVTCTFTNTKRGQIVVVKDAQPNGAQDFSFTAGGGLSPTSFQLDDDTDGTLSNSRTFANVVPGSGYTLSETEPDGWDQTGASCSDGSPVTNIGVSAGETVTCTFENTKRAQLTITKDAQPDSAQDFSFTAGGGLSPASFDLDDDADGTLPSSRSFGDVQPGTYSVSESPVAGWDITSATCSDGSPPSAIALAPGENVTCTFTNRQRGSLVVLEDSTPDDPQDFSFTAGGGLSPSSFQLDDDANGTLSNTRTFSGVVSGTYSLTETVPSGWLLTSASCDDGSPTTSIDIAPGETVTCTFTNTKRGSIVVNEDSVPNDPQDFSFTAGGGLSPSSFQLDDDSDGTLSSSYTFSDVVPAGGYSLAETIPGGWDLTSATCNDGSPVADITVNPGETVTCTFTNTKRGSIVAVKDAQPNDPQDFSFTAGGGLSPGSFQLDDDSDGTLSNSRTFASVAPGSGYTLSETVPGGWSQTGASCSDGSAVDNIGVSPGETVTCTFENTKRAQLTIVKDAQPDSAQDFSFTAGGGLSPASFELDDDADGTLSSSRSFTDVDPGTYSVSESPVAGWDITSATCSDGSPPSAIALAPGENVTCTFTNRKRGSVVVTADSIPDDPQDFSFTAGGGLSPTSFQLDDDSDGTLSNTRTFADVTAGTYSVSESVPGGWLLDSATCDDGSPASAIDVAPGETVTCTFTNTKRGSIVVVKDAQPNDAQDFTFTAGGGLSPAGFALDDDSDGTLSNTRTFANVAPGSGYSLSESVPSGWDQSSATCDDGSPASNIDVAPGETVTCTFTNTKRGSIVVVKDAQPNDAQDFSFTAGGGLSPTGFSLDDDSDGTLSNTRTFANVAPGSGYSLSESVPSGWEQNSAVCDDGSPPANVDVAPAETVTCTFTNRKRGTIVVVKDALPDDAQDFTFTAGGGLSPASFQLDDDSDGTLSNTRTFGNLAPQAGYSVSESIPVGWGQDSASCSDGSPPSNIDVGLGETVTCTFVNIRGYARPKGASPFRSSLVPAYTECTGATNSTHGPPLSSPSCKPPVLRSSYLTAGTPDSNGRAANMTGFIVLHVVNGNAGTQIDEADVQFDMSLADIRNKSDLSDYAGAVSATLTVRRTDRSNGPGNNEPATGVDVPFSVQVPCTATISTTIGSSCAASTTADAVVPGAVVENKRAIWHLTDVEVYDGGADGDPLTAGNTVFARQGVFIP